MPGARNKTITKPKRNAAVRACEESKLKWPWCRRPFEFYGGAQATISREPFDQLNGMPVCRVHRAKYNWPFWSRSHRIAYSASNMNSNELISICYSTFNLPQMKEQICYCQKVAAAIIQTKYNFHHISSPYTAPFCGAHNLLVPSAVGGCMRRALLVMFVFNLKIMQTITQQTAMKDSSFSADCFQHHYDFRNGRRWNWTSSSHPRLHCSIGISIQLDFSLLRFLLLAHSVPKSKDRCGKKNLSANWN